MTRIISGQFKGRKIPTIQSTKPTTQKMREAIFSIIMHHYGSLDSLCLLDLFSGSGTISFEAISRGINSVTLVDINKEQMDLCKEFSIKLNIQSKMRFINQSIHFFKSNKDHYDIVYIDPPYKQKELYNIAMNKISHLVNNKSLVLVESDDKNILADYKDIIMDQRYYGDSYLTIIKYD